MPHGAKIARYKMPNIMRCARDNVISKRIITDFRKKRKQKRSEKRKKSAIILNFVLKSHSGVENIKTAAPYPPICSVLKGQPCVFIVSSL